MELNKIRHLDVDDLMIMKMVLKKVYMADIAKKLMLTPPAVSHRLRKYANVFGSDIYNSLRDHKGGVAKDRKDKGILTERGTQIFTVCAKALNKLIS